MRNSEGIKTEERKAVVLVKMRRMVVRLMK